MGFAVLWGVVAFAGVFTCGFTVGFNPPLWVAALPWVVGLGLGLAALVGTKRAVQAAGDDQTWQLTVRGRVTPFDQVQGVEVRERHSTGDDGPTTYHFKCVVVYAGESGASAEREVYEFPDRADADRLAAWLREQIGLGGQ